MKSALSRSYDVRMVDGALRDQLEIHVAGRKTLIVTTPSISRLYPSLIAPLAEGRGRSCAVVELQVSEQSKSLDVVRAVCQAAIERSLDRRSVLISIGGGVCSDVVTMAASLVRRGIANIRIPTTLVGQVDAAVGIKGAVNLSGKKSAVGCYYPPETVLVDPLFLKTLPSCQLQNGFAEIAKIAITSDESLFCLMERCGPKVIREGFLPHDNHHRQIVWTAAVRMLEQLQPNLYEDQTFRRLVGFGHTFSPALESASGFSLQHGQAVAIDMALSAVLAFELGMMDANRRDRILDLLLCIGLPVHSPLLTTILCESALQEAKLHRGGHVNLVLPTGLSDMVFMESLESLLAPLANSLRWLERNSGKRMSSLQHVRHETSGMQNGIPLRI